MPDTNARTFCPVIFSTAEMKSSLHACWKYRRTAEPRIQSRACDEATSGQPADDHSQRPQLERLFDQLREGDTLVVWRLDRLGRSLKDTW